MAMMIALILMIVVAAVRRKAILLLLPGVENQGTQYVGTRTLEVPTRTFIACLDDQLT